MWLIVRLTAPKSRKKPQPFGKELLKSKASASAD